MGCDTLGFRQDLSIRERHPFCDLQDGFCYNDKVKSKYLSMLKANPVVWFEIYVEDLERAKKFYETVFDTKLGEIPTPEGGSLQMLSFSIQMEGEGSSGALVKMEGYEPSGSGTIVYFSSPDCAVEESRVEAAGGKVFKPKMSIGEYGFISLFIDTEGNIVGIHSQN